MGRKSSRRFSSLLRQVYNYERFGRAQYVPFNTALTLSEVNFVVRCHQHWSGGLRSFHDGKLLSIFSSSPYCGDDNQAVMATFEGIKPQTHATFWLLDKSYPYTMEYGASSPTYVSEGKNHLECVAKALSSKKGRILFFKIERVRV